MYPPGCTVAQEVVAWQGICIGARVQAAAGLDELAAELADRALALVRAATVAAARAETPATPTEALTRPTQALTRPTEALTRLGLADRREIRDRFVYDLLLGHAGEE